jgi:hypothetical protein
MDIEEYNCHLNALHSYERWLRVPVGDRLLFWTFGTIAPKILLRRHRLVLDQPGHLQALLTLLETEVATLRCPEDFDYSSCDSPSLQVCVRAWQEENNQRRLVRICESKPEAPARNLAFDAHLNADALAELADSEVNTRYVDSDFANDKWFDALNELVETCGWFYISITEMTTYNLVIFNESTATKYQSLIDSNLITRCLEFRDGRPVWPA